jgi:hypothetical protein
MSIYVLILGAIILYIAYNIARVLLSPLNCKGWVPLILLIIQFFAYQKKKKHFFADNIFRVTNLLFSKQSLQFCFLNKCHIALKKIIVNFLYGFWIYEILYSFPGQIFFSFLTNTINIKIFNNKESKFCTF